MKINSVNAYSRKTPNFKAVLTKNVERGFDNLGYRIKKEYGEDSGTYETYKRNM